MIKQFEENKDLKFCKIKKGTKKPYERDWVNKPYSWEEIQEHKRKEINYGILCGYGGLIVIDSDTPELKEAVDKGLPKSMKVKTGSGGCHDYYICKELKKKIVLQGEKHYGEVQSFGSQVVGPNSIHPNGNKYELSNNLPIIEITLPELTTVIKPFMQEIHEEEIKVLGELKDYGESDINSLSITTIMNTSGFKKAYNKNEYFGVNPWHGSSTGMNTWVNPSKNVAHCFRCNAGINVAKAIALNESIIKNCHESLSKDDFKRVLEIAQMRYGLKKPERTSGAKILTSKLEQAKEYSKFYPIFFDKTGMFWMWNENTLSWEVSDDVEVLNFIERTTGKDIIDSKNRTEIINSLKQEGRKNIPKSIKKTWIQFHDRIYDVMTGEEFNAVPEYYVTNPIPWKLSQDKMMDTPVMDLIFKEWVGEENVKLLYEILAYCCLPDYPIHRLFCLVGEGMNGKSSFIELLKRFIGYKNVTSTELDTLLDSRFEITRCHKKLVCIMGETNFSEMSKTSIIKKLTGGDLIGFEYKNKTPFDDHNYAKLIIATNNLPTTTDKTAGFYRRWLIIDFPNRFSEKEDILSKIPQEEFEHLALKCVHLLKDLLDKREFSNEGTIEERTRRFEERSNPLDKFFKENITDEFEGFIYKFEFRKYLDQWCKENRFRQISDRAVSEKMKDLNVQTERRTASWFTKEGDKPQINSWSGIKWKSSVNNSKSSFNDDKKHRENADVQNGSISTGGVMSEKEGYQGYHTSSHSFPYREKSGNCIDIPATLDNFGWKINDRRKSQHPFEGPNKRKEHPK